MYPHSKCLLSTYHGFYGLPRLENKKKTEKKREKYIPLSLSRSFWVHGAEKQAHHQLKAAHIILCLEKA